jgi:hypothetical protein
MPRASHPDFGDPHRHPRGGLTTDRSFVSFDRRV